ncbi:MAG: hypothetical protein IPO32_17390 [Crocinitomicaceae bacterium]|nr:hypothetical protein [Crocinitomicaceae bacterium]
MAGKLCYSNTVSNQTALNLPLENGVYIIELVVSGIRHNVKLIIQ